MSGRKQDYTQPPNMRAALYSIEFADVDII
jgi:hypothetical protein